MFELTIKDNVYQFRFGMGFVREIDKTKTQTADNGVTQNVGLQYAVAALIDEDPVEVVNILYTANKTEKDRVSKEMLDAYIEDENTDFEALCKEVLDFFKQGNCTKKKTNAVIALVEAEKARVNQTE